MVDFIEWTVQLVVELIVVELSCSTEQYENSVECIMLIESARVRPMWWSTIITMDFNKKLTDNSVSVTANLLGNPESTSTIKFLLANQTN